jgi:glycosyltransferase involved in cell wall biosynthesis
MFSLHIDTARTWRGGQAQVLYTVTGLRARGKRTVLVAHPRGELRRRMANGSDLIALAPRTEFDPVAAWRLVRVLRRLRPEVVHAHDPHGVAVAALAMTSLRTSPPLVASRRIEFSIGQNRLSRWKYQQVDGFIANSEAIRGRLLASAIPPTKTTVVHEGVDVDAIARLQAADARAALGLPREARIVGNIAALVPHKGQHDLIDAAAIVVRAVPEAQFVICGDGESRRALEDHIRRRQLKRHVVLTGFRTDVLALLKDFDLFALSSVAEGMCTALVEAMAASKAAVATCVGGVPEVLADGETGFLVPPCHPEAMAARIIELLRDEALRLRMGRAARERAREAFTIDRMVDGTIAAYDTLLNAGTFTC